MSPIHAALQPGAALSPLAAFRQFILVKLVPLASGKTDKLPISAITGDVVNAHDPAHWISAAEAVELLPMWGDGYCLGFVFTTADPFWFLDIDSAWNGSEWSQLATGLCQRLQGAAVELSQSGTGLHLFGTGTVPAHGCKNVPLHLELYTEGRFVALTGTHASGLASWDGSAVMPGLVAEYFPGGEERIAQEWSSVPVPEYGPERPDAEVLDRAMGSLGAMGGVRFASLWGADAAELARRYPHESRAWDESSADGALAMQLAFWTGKNCEQIQRLMWQSGLVRPKWSDHRTYLQRTILSACGRVKDVYAAGKRAAAAEPDPRGPIAAPKPGTVYALNVPLSPGAFNQLHMSAGSSPKPYGTVDNFRSLMHWYGLTISYNEILKEIDILGPGLPVGGDMRENAVLGILNSVASLNKFPREAVSDGITVMANENTTNPVRDWIDSAPWDGADHIGRLFQTMTLTDEEDPVFAAMLFRRWFMGAAAIGTGLTDKFEFALVLVEESGGEGKTRWFNKLCPKAWQKEGLHVDPDNPDSRKAAISTWLVEMGELDSTVNKTDAARLKAFMAASSDEIRLPYARTSNKYPRRAAFMGTVNQMCFLLDESGNRRFWPIRIDRVDYQHTVDMQQVWSQARAAVVAGERFWLDSAENKAVANRNIEFRAADNISDKLSELWPTTGPEAVHMTVSKILEMVGIREPKRQQLNRAATWLRERNFRNCKLNGVRGFWLPRPKLQNLVMPPNAPNLPLKSN